MTDPFASVEDGSSLSGHERNVLFVRRPDGQFEDLSGISGADDPADGRAVALLDYDRDGWEDLAVVNANSPQIQLFRNEIGERPAAPPGNVIAFRLIGGNHAPTAAEGLSNRDGVGARIEVELPDRTLVRTRRAGEGFAAQNSATLLVGIGAETEVGEVSIRWPSGRVQQHGPIPAGSVVTVREEPDAGGDAITLAPYAIHGLAAAAARSAPGPAAQAPRLAAGLDRADPASLRLLTTMATWCESCKGELPQLALLGVPIDEDDGERKLERYVKEHRPSYELLTDLPEPQIEAVRERILTDLRIDALPATIATDARGRVLRTMWSVPSVSEVRELIELAARL